MPISRDTVLARRTAARTVATAFMPAERAAEQAAVQAAHCIDVMVEQRTLAGLPAHTGADEMILVAKALTLALESYAAFAEAHRTLIKIPEANDMSPTFGPGCGPNKAVLKAVDRDVA